jgi:hypothetical protein
MQPVQVDGTGVRYHEKLANTRHSEIEKRLHQMEAVFRHMNERLPGANAETRQDEPDDVSEIIEVSHVAPLSDTLSAEYLPDNDQIGRGDNGMEFVWSFDRSSLTPAAANSSPAPVSAADATGMLTPVTSSGDQFSKDEDLLDQILSGKPESPPFENNAAVWIRTEVGFPTPVHFESFFDRIDSTN